MAPAAGGGIPCGQDGPSWARHRWVRAATFTAAVQVAETGEAATAVIEVLADLCTRTPELGWRLGIRLG